MDDCGKGEKFVDNGGKGEKVVDDGCKDEKVDGCGKEYLKLLGDDNDNGTTLCNNDKYELVLLLINVGLELLFIIFIIFVGK